MATEQGAPSRRRFHIAFIYGIWSAISAVLAAPAAVYLMWPPRAREREGWIEAGELGSFEPGEPEEVVFRRTRKDGWKMVSEKATAWIARVGERGVVAYAPQCTHLGCAYHWDEKQKNFLCPCHTSTFALDGTVLAGPAPRPLDRYEVRVEGNKILLGRVVRSDERA